MKFTSIALAGSAAAVAAASGTTGHMANARSAGQKLPELTSANRMGTLKQLKMSERDAERAAGMFEEGRWPSMRATACQNGSAGDYSCSNVDLHASLSHGEMGSTEREGNDIWGWTSADGREFAIVGQTDGTAFVEVTSTGLTYLGRLPTQDTSSVWRDMKVIGSHVYIGSESRRHGIQIFDLEKLLDVNPRRPVTFSTRGDLTAHFSGVGNSHNVIVNEESETLYVVGASVCRGGLVMVDVSDPSSPRQVGCADEDGYVHDAQCVIYQGVDEAFRGKEVCFGYNEDTFTVYDVSDKANPVVVSRTGYRGSAYTHQGWVVDADFRYVLLDDELDEQYSGEGETKTYIFDISSLADPVWTGTFTAAHRAIDHNQYVKDGLSYQANYGSGLRILDVSNLAEDPTGGAIEEVGFFDCYPADDANPRAAFVGAWSVYPYFASGTLIVNCIEGGLYAVKYTG